MAYDIRKVKTMTDLIGYFSQNLQWNIDVDDFDDIEDISYDFDAEDIGLKKEAFAKISSLRQLQPLVDGQRWGIFCVEFDSDKFEVTALRKILSGLVPKRRNSADHAVWDQKDLMFICNWGKDNNRTIGIAHFEDKDSGLPQIKMISCAPAMEDFTQIKVFEDRMSHLAWPRNTNNIDAWRESWASAFVSGYRQTIHDSVTLAVQLAAEAQNIRDRIMDILEVESRNGYVHLLYEKFRNTLIHDMTEQQFADMYAQTVVYGLFSARCMDDTQENFSADEAIDCIPNTNPFLKSLMKECLGSENNTKLSFDELEISNVVELLRNTRIEAIIQDFNRQTDGGREDPVIHFYEEFLTAYDKAQKVQRGVYYTPQPVVNFMVRAVDSIIKERFGLHDGLASEETKKIKVKRQSKKKQAGFYKEVDEFIDVPAIQVLDPATGTGTFLRQTILQIYENFKEKHKGLRPDQLAAEWNRYVPTQLLPRLNGFELMMAPYAVAHMKLAMVLKDTGYDFSADSRLKVYLTNSLEEPGSSDEQLSFFDDPLAIESIEANGVKKNSGINIVLGNPPYSGGSANKGEWILNLLDLYRFEPGGKVRLKETKTHIDNDYIKFIRYAQYLIEQNNKGVVAYINPRDYLFSPTFRGVRWQFMHYFDEIYILDLHGDMRQNKNSATSDIDENVFDIQQGVCIEIFVKTGTRKGQLANVYHKELRGTRESKFEILQKSDLQDLHFERVETHEPFFSFKPINYHAAFENSFSISDLFLASVNGIQTGRDILTIQPSEQQMNDVLLRFIEMQEDDARQAFDLGNDGRDWRVAWAQRDVKTHLDSNGIVTPILYRPFDVKWTFYTGPSGKGFLQCPRGTLMQNMVGTNNIALVIGRQGQAVGNIEWCLAYISCGMPTDLNLFYRGGGMVFPLFVYPETTAISSQSRRTNINKEIAEKFSQQIGAKYLDDIVHTHSSKVVSPTDIVYYIYAILYSKKYRYRYKDLLAVDFPKIPYPKNYNVFSELAKLGKQLVDLHTLSHVSPISDYPILGDNVVGKFSFADGKIKVNTKQYFTSVSNEAWNYYIGGYQPLQKWLKDRKHTALSSADIEHYKCMISAIEQTIQLMREIDNTIEL